MQLKRKIKPGELTLQEQVVAINRVTTVTEGGRKFSFSAIVVVGDNQGIVGWGSGKALEVTSAIAKAIENAKKNLIQVPILKNTLPHEAIGKFGGAMVLIKPAAPGTGIIAGGGARAVLECAGVNNVLSKSKGSSNPHNNVKATIRALSQMRDPFTIATQRGISLEKVFNG